MAEFEDLLDQKYFQNICKNLESLHIEGKSKVNIKASIIDFKGLKSQESLKKIGLVIYYSRNK